jgi:hypothetical protein
LNTCKQFQIPSTATRILIITPEICHPIKILSRLSCKCLPEGLNRRKKSAPAYDPAFSWQSQTELLRPPEKKRFKNAFNSLINEKNETKSH